MEVCKIRGGWSSLRVSGSVLKTTRGNNGKEKWKLLYYHRVYIGVT